MTKGNWLKLGDMRDCAHLNVVRGALAAALGMVAGCSLEASSEDVRPPSDPNPVTGVVEQSVSAESPSDECIDGKVERNVACANGEGLGKRVCVGGAWQTKTCDCTSAGEEYDVLADACLVPVACDRNARPFGGGDGEIAPYLICTRRHLDNVSTAPTARFLLARSMDLRHGVNFTPLNHPSLGLGDFSGEFDGGGRVLRGLVIDRSSATLGAAEDHVGLFGRTDGATLKDLELRDFTVRGRGLVGALAGDPWLGLVERVTVSGGSVTGEGATVGGLVGYLEAGDVADSTSSATVQGASTVGGLVGAAWGCRIEGSSAHGPVSSLGDTAGGLVGSLGDGGIYQSKATGSVVGQTEVGGLLGAAAGTPDIVESVATGDVSGTTRVGGLIGGVGSELSLVRSYATGDVTATGQDVGGLLGDAFIWGGYSIRDSYSFGLVDWTGSGTPPATLGALVGHANVSIFATFAREQVPALPLVGVLEGYYGVIVDSDVIAPSTFADEATFLGWDFDNVWSMSTELGRPILRWELED